MQIAFVSSTTSSNVTARISALFVYRTDGAYRCTFAGSHKSKLQSSVVSCINLTTTRCFACAGRSVFIFPLTTNSVHVTKSVPIYCVRVNLLAAHSCILAVEISTLNYSLMCVQSKGFPLVRCDRHISGAFALT